MRIDINSDTRRIVRRLHDRARRGVDAVDHVGERRRRISCRRSVGPARRRFGSRRAHGVAVGAHPGFPDLVGFGRRELNVTPQEAEDLVLYQIAAVAGVAAAEGVKLQHVKPHGALFNMAVRNAELAARLRGRSRRSIKTLILFGLPGSEILNAGRAAGLRVAAEVFADRAYEPDGSLRSRRKPSSVIHDAAAVVARAVRMVKEKSVVAIDGTIVPLEADTICVHGDTPGSDDLAAKIRAGLEAAGVTVKAIGAQVTHRRTAMTPPSSSSTRDAAGLFGWWTEADARARHAFVAAALGLDARLLRRHALRDGLRGADQRPDAAPVARAKAACSARSR